MPRCRAAENDSGRVRAGGADAAASFSTRPPAETIKKQTNHSIKMAQRGLLLGVTFKSRRLPRDSYLS